MSETLSGLKISEHDLVCLIRPLVLDDLSGVDDAVDLFCSAAWSQLCEPGDALAGLLVEALGSQQALSLVISRADPKIFIEQITNAGFFAEASQRFADLAGVLKLGLARWTLRLSMQDLETSLKTHAQLSGNLISESHQLWPSGLRDLGWSSPRVLWSRGALRTLPKFEASLSLVGSRSATNYGEQVVTELVSGVVERDVTIISGGAFGIDGIAHRSAMALEANTVAIMAGGLDRLYPLGNSQVLNRIVEKGIIISELPPGVPPTKWRFLQRNRLIAAMSVATVVVEAGARSGSINTANHALELQRQLGAVPGPITSQTSAGCHRLIRDQAAQLVACASDVLELMGVWQTTTTLDQLSWGPLETRVYDAIGFGSKTLETICKSAGLTPNEAAMALGSLELLGDIERHLNRWQRAKSI